MMQTKCGEKLLLLLEVITFTKCQEFVAGVATPGFQQHTGFTTIFSTLFALL